MYITQRCESTTNTAARHQLTILRHLSTYGHRAFAVAGTTRFNTLPNDLWDPSVSTATFQQLLRNHLFSAYQHVQRIFGVSHKMCNINLHHLLTYLPTDSSCYTCVDNMRSWFRYQPILDGKDCLFRSGVVVSFHCTIHRRQFHLTFEVHRHSAVLHRRVPKVLLWVPQLPTHTNSQFTVTIHNASVCISVPLWQIRIFGSPAAPVQCRTALDNHHLPYIHAL